MKQLLSIFFMSAIIMASDITLKNDIPITTQNNVDKYAWETFTFIMRPNKSQTDGLRAWETWKEESEVYRHKKKVPELCQNNNGMLYRTLYRNEQLDATGQAVKSDGTLPGTLTDQNAKLVHYEIRMNHIAANYIVENKLYDREKQKNKKNIKFTNGSMIIKASWRELLATEHDAFLSRTACICDEEESTCYKADVGLVGLHIMRKTESAPQWLWSTFEHRANVKPSHGLPASFNNPSCEGEYCSPNSQVPSKDKDGRRIPNQVTQLLAIPSDLKTLNKKIQDGFKKDDFVLSYYQLMSAQ
jgi:hypothetical protein